MFIKRKGLFMKTLKVFKPTESCCTISKGIEVPEALI